MFSSGSLLLLYLQFYGVRASSETPLPDVLPLRAGARIGVEKHVWTPHSTISGQDFFDSFVFKERWDNTTHGATYYVNKKTAHKLQLAYVNEKNQAIIAVDTSTDLSASHMPAVVLNTTDGTFKVNKKGLRKSVRIESLERYDTGSLFVADFHHAPYGCATWGSFWMHGEDWPNNGELDVYEGFNDHVGNRATLHTSAGCSHDPRAKQTGKVLQETCDASVNYNFGCAVEDPNPESYGAKFNEVGGGVYAAMYTDKQIAVWHWSRDDVPKDIKTNPRPETWGTPVGSWLSGSSCNIARKFGPQNLIFTITTCGDADYNTYKTSKCPGTCWDQLLKGSNYKEAYFAVNYIKVFKSDSASMDVIN